MAHAIANFLVRLRRWSNELGRELLYFPRCSGWGFGPKRWQPWISIAWTRLQSQCRILIDAVEINSSAPKDWFFSIALSICLSGFVVWFVVSDQWFVLKDQISARNRRWFAHSLCKDMRNKERVDSIFVIRELVQLQTQAVMAIILLGMCVKLSLLNWSSTLFLVSKSHLLLLFGS